MLLEFKLSRLLSILRKRGTITKEERFALVVAHEHHKHQIPENYMRERLREFLYDKRPWVRRASIDIISNRNGFFDRMKHYYLNHVLPFLNKTNLLSLYLSRN